MDRKAMMDQMNLDFIKRKDPDVEQILGSSAHVTMYVMSVESRKWERRNVEGSLYICKRRTTPRFQLMVLNKLDTVNYVEGIESGFHAEVSPPYLIYTQGGGTVHGIWFYESADLEKIAGLLQKVEAGLPAVKEEVAAPDTTATQANAAGRQPTIRAQQPTAPAADNDDALFWDKPASVGPPTKALQPNAMLLSTQPEQATPATPNNNALTSLFQKAQAKQQNNMPRQEPAPAPSPQPAVPSANNTPAGGAGPLPPSFFLQPQTAQATPPQPAGTPAGPPSFPESVRPTLPPPPSSQSVDGGESALNKLFAKQTLQPQATPPATQQGSLAALFSKAAQAADRAASLQPPTQPVKHAPAQATATQHADRLRTALTNLVQRDDFITMFVEELRNAGVLQ